jgi:predicted DNA binding CopG/RHH family protein
MKERIVKLKQVRVRIEEVLISQFKKEAKMCGMSLSSYMNYVLNSAVKKEKVLFEEIIDKKTKKDIVSRVRFTQSEIELLKKYANSNGWSITKEIRFRIILTLAKKPKLNAEELKAIYSVRSSINVLGANLNRIVRDNRVISDHNIIVCKELAELIQELRAKINWLDKCNRSSFEIITK